MDDSYEMIITLLLQSNDFDKVAGQVMLFIIVGAALLFLLWATISNANESKKTAEKIQSMKRIIPEVNTKWNDLINTLEVITEPNCKCHLPLYRIFEIYEDGSIEYRCMTCTKKDRHSNVRLKHALKAHDARETDHMKVFEEVMNYQWKIDSINNSNYGNFNNSITAWDIPCTRGPWYRGITFKPNKELEQEQGKRRRYISSQTKQTVWDRDGGKCVNCGKEYDLEFDHIIPYSKGGSNSPNNIQLLCRDCNSKKRAKII